MKDSWRLREVLNGSRREELTSTAAPSCTKLRLYHGGCHSWGELQSLLLPHGVLVAVCSSTPTHGGYHIVEAATAHHGRRCLLLSQRGLLAGGLRFVLPPQAGEGGLEMAGRWR